MIKDVTPDMVPEVPTDHPIKDSLRAGVFFLLSADSKTLLMLLGLFVTNYILWGSEIKIYTLLSLIILDKELLQTVRMTVLSLLTGLSFLPLVVFTMRRSVLGEAEETYFSYFLISPLWRLYVIRWVFLIFIVTPVFLAIIVLLLSFGAAFTVLEPLTSTLNFSVLLPGTLLFVCALFSRFLLIFAHVPIKNRLELWPVFFLSKGHAFAITVSTFASVIPVILMALTFNYFISSAQIEALTAMEMRSALLFSLLITTIGALSFIPSAVLAHLYKIIVTLRKEILRAEGFSLISR
ncbi:MAG: hypothetical protein H2057_03775 [Alphaproteobacteria bacterium]|nr:hypothetical protein [Alphaproteobacteria bacterium]